MSIDEASEKNVTALFGEKYEDQVRVLSMGVVGDNDASVELCGGTHVKNLGNIGLFIIISEKGISSGVRRIEAKTGYGALQYLKSQDRKLKIILQEVGLKQEKVEYDRIELNPKKAFDDSFDGEGKFNDLNIKSVVEIEKEEKETLFLQNAIKEKLSKIKKQEKIIDNLKKQALLSDVKNFEKIQFSNQNFLEINLIYNLFRDTDVSNIRQLAGALKSRKEYKDNYIMLFLVEKNYKVNVILSISKNISSVVQANKVIAEISALINGKGGGGSAELAFSGGGDFSKIDKNFIKNIKKLLF